MDCPCWHWRWRKLEVCPVVDWSEQAAVWSRPGQLTGVWPPSLMPLFVLHTQETLPADPRCLSRA